MRRLAPDIYRWTRDLHLYVGLFLSPFVLLYAVSTLFINHAFLPWGGRAAKPEPAQTVRVVATDNENGLLLAQQIQAQLGIRGEIGFVSRRPGGQRLTFPIETPGRTTSVRVDLSTGVATLERKDTGRWDALVYLHKMPGQHNANIRGNWVFMRLWSWLADGTVYLILFLTATGVYLWTALRADRRTGALMLVGGALTFIVLVTLVVAT